MGETGRVLPDPRSRVRRLSPVGRPCFLVITKEAKKILRIKFVRRVGHGRVEAGEARELEQEKGVDDAEGVGGGLPPLHAHPQWQRMERHFFAR